MRLLKSHPILRLANSYLVDSPQPINLSYLWNFGSLLVICLIIQTITGVTLTMHYNSCVLEGLISVLYTLIFCTAILFDGVMGLVTTWIYSLDFHVINCDGADAFSNAYFNKNSSNYSTESFFVTTICIILSLVLIYHWNDTSDTLPVPLDELRRFDERMVEADRLLDSLRAGNNVELGELMYNYFEVTVILNYYREILANNVGSHLAPIGAREQVLQEYLTEFMSYMV